MRSRQENAGQTKSDGNEKSKREPARRKAGFASAKVRFHSRDDVMVRRRTGLERSGDAENVSRASDGSDYCTGDTNENGSRQKDENGQSRESGTIKAPKRVWDLNKSALKRQVLVSLPLTHVETRSRDVETHQHTRRHDHHHSNVPSKTHLTPSERADRALARRHAEALLAAKTRAARETNALCRKAKFLESRLTAATTRLVKARSSSVRPSIIPYVHRTCSADVHPYLTSEIRDAQFRRDHSNEILSRPEPSKPPDKTLLEEDRCDDPPVLMHGSNHTKKSLRQRSEKIKQETSIEKKSHRRQPKAKHSNNAIRIPTPSIPVSPSIPTPSPTNSPDLVKPSVHQNLGNSSTDDDAKVESDSKETLLDTESQNGQDDPNPRPHSSSSEPISINENSASAISPSTIIDKISVFSARIARSPYTRQAFLTDRGLPPGIGMTATDKSRCLEFRDRLEKKILQLVTLYCTLDDKISFAISAEGEYELASSKIVQTDSNL